MKTEINDENKYKFFAQHYGQFIGLDPEKEDRPCYVMIGDNIRYSESISLKPLSAISDEDAIEVAKMSRKLSNFTDKKDWKIFEKNNHFMVLTWLSDKSTSGSDWTYKLVLYLSGSLGYQFLSPKYKRGEAQIDIISISDFLRSRGYALPWMGLTVEEMIVAGWIRLETDTISIHKTNTLIYGH